MSTLADVPMVPIEEAAQLYGVSRDTLDRLAAKGLLPKYRKAGDRRVYVDTEEVKAALGFRPVE